MKTLKVGDNITTEHSGVIINIRKVDRITEKFAFIGTTKFRREFDLGGFVTRFPHEKWSMTTYRLATEKDWEQLENQNRRARLMRAFDKIKVKDLSNDQLESIARMAGIDVEKA